MKPSVMYALERRVSQKNRLCRCWTRYGVSGNRPLLEKVLAGQHEPKNWRVVPLTCSVGSTSGILPKSA